MAVRPERAIRQGFLWRRCSRGLIAARALLMAVCFIPAYVAARSGIAERYGRLPQVVEHDGPPPFHRVVDLLTHIPTSFFVLAAVGMACMLLLDQILTAGAMVLLDPDRVDDPSRRIWRLAWAEGSPHLWRMVRVFVFAVAIFLVGNLVLSLVFEQLQRHGRRAGYDGLTLQVALPAMKLIATSIWLAFVGALVFWCRLLTVADERRYVRRTAVCAFQVCWRKPLGALLFFVTLTLGVQLLGGVVIVAFAPPQQHTSAFIRLLLWAVFLLIHCAAWHWLIHAGRHLYRSPDLADLRAAADAPLGLFRWLPWKG